MNNELRLRLLETIAENDGEFGWYQLDRSLSSSGVVINERLLNVLRELEATGLITSMVIEMKKDPVYKITNDGKEAIAAIK